MQADGHVKTSQLLQTGELTRTLFLYILLSEGGKFTPPAFGGKGKWRITEERSIGATRRRVETKKSWVGGGLKKKPRSAIVNPPALPLEVRDLRMATTILNENVIPKNLLKECCIQIFHSCLTAFS